MTNQLIQYKRQNGKSFSFETNDEVLAKDVLINLRNMNCKIEYCSVPGNEVGTNSAVTLDYKNKPVTVQDIQVSQTE